MERVATLINKLKDQLDKAVSAEMLLQTVQMLQSELLLNRKEVTRNGTARVAVIMPSAPSINIVQELSLAEPEVIPEPGTKVPDEPKTVELLQVDESEIEAELEEIKKNAEIKNKLSLHSKPGSLFDHMEEHSDDVPTLTHQRTQVPVLTSREINDTRVDNTTSLNERLKESRLDLAEKLTDAPIRDLRKAIGINDRFLYINELFRGDEAMYERSIKTINNFSILPEAEYWIQRELKVKIGWKDQDEVVKQFDQLVRRRFS